MVFELPRHPDGRPRMVTRVVRRALKPTVGVVVPAYGVEAYLAATLDSLIAQTYPHWRCVVVDDGSPDRSGEIADAYAAQDRRITVLHTDNGGLGAARNRGTKAVKGEYLAYLDSDDVLAPDALEHLVATAEESGSDFVAAVLQRVEAEPPAGEGTFVPEWLANLHSEPRRRIRIEDHCEMLGDVFAVTKLWRRRFWDAERLSWPERIRYEDQPTTTRAFLAGTFDVTTHVVYDWVIRTDGTSITQQRHTVADLLDRWRTKEWTVASVEAHGDAHVTEVFWTKILPGDLWMYFSQIPGADDEWWTELHGGLTRIWGERSLLDSILVPHERITGWLVQQGRRADAERLVSYVEQVGADALPHSADGLRLALPADVLDLKTLPADVDVLREWEIRVS
ncbi:glycosyltransferase family 2 protein [Nocardioides yefusunii]|uniref:Glycosyltransferase family 2 protein n=1 Tax=Nocardioides yefusunii TaxID=2500546 RepID=A0ABW1QWN3_9ACTN|nr:glycosyltransferase family 2 protein [Nocardioides yefusunii]